MRKDDTGKTTVGPDSVGYRIHESLSFGGNTLTATDIVVAAGLAPGVGKAELVKDLKTADLDEARARMKTMLELAMDSMKTNTQDIPAYLVGGGAILAPDTLRGVSKVHRFPFYDAANAVGAACAQVSGVIDTFEDTSTNSIAEVQRKVEKRAIEKAIAAGANPEKTVIVESESIPIACESKTFQALLKDRRYWTMSILRQGSGRVDGVSHYGRCTTKRPHGRCRGGKSEFFCRIESDCTRQPEARHSSYRQDLDRRCYPLVQASCDKRRMVSIGD